MFLLAVVYTQHSSFSFGLFSIGDHDLQIIATAMEAKLPE